MARPDGNRAQRVARGVLAGGFLLLIALPAVGVRWCDTARFVEQNERRAPAASPMLEYRPGRIWPRKRSLAAFPAAFENWFHDRLGYRRQMTALAGSARAWGLAPSGLAGNRHWVGTPVIVGREGWLFYGGESSVESYRRTRPFTPEELHQWRAALSARARWLAARGIRYVVVVAPDKHTVYPQFMPRSLEPREGPSRLDQLLAALREEQGLAVIDLRGRLAQWKDRWRLYHKTDTHWNDVGAMLAGEHLIERLREWFPEARPADPGDFAIDVEPGAGGDLARMLGSPWGWQEERLRARPRRRKRVTAADVADAPWRTRIAENPEGELDRVLVLHDSFLEALEPYFAAHWRRACFVRTYGFPTDAIERERPQLVVHQFVERHLMQPPPSAAFPGGSRGLDHPTGINAE